MQSFDQLSNKYLLCASQILDTENMVVSLVEEMNIKEFILQVYN